MMQKRNRFLMKKNLSNHIPVIRVIRSSKVPARLSPPVVTPCGDAVSPKEIQKARSQTGWAGF
jgi:hypothetical protein